jgi:excisionase family DNA binding protein
MLHVACNSCHLTPVDSHCTVLPMTDELLTVADVAERLKVTPAAVYAWIRDKQLPTVLAGSLIRIRRSELDAWLERDRATP